MEQLTINKLIEFLEKARKEHGGDVPVYSVGEYGDLEGSYSVDIAYVTEGSDKKKVTIVLIR